MQAATTLNARPPSMSPATFARRSTLAIVLLLALAAGLTDRAYAQPSRLPAFPGAEGFGAVATGGRGGEVVRVTTLQPFGEGSLGAALDPDQCRPRTVVFTVSGLIEGDFDLTCGDLTLAGQTAPGAGITIHGRIDGYDADPGGNLIIRHIRVRAPEADPDKAHFHDPIQLSNNPVAILDHVTASWGTDETIDLFEGTSDVTIQWSTIEESRVGGHPDGPDHNYGVIVGPDVPRVSLHHNLFAHHRSRAPAVAAGPAEVVNNVVYDTQDGFVHHNPAAGEFQIVGNVYRAGPSADLYPLFFDDEDPGGATYVLRDNLIDDPGRFEGTVDSPDGIDYEGFDGFDGDLPISTQGSDFSTESDGYVPITTSSAEDVIGPVLARAGAFPRDATTVRTILEVENREGGWGADEPDDLTAGLTAGDPPADADADGLADDWERANGL
ncbi:MAG TPA: hypothetical protein VGA36_01430, partial [Nitriliruptorales bacterium]